MQINDDEQAMALEQVGWAEAAIAAFDRSRFRGEDAEEVTRAKAELDWLNQYLRRAREIASG